MLRIYILMEISSSEPGTTKGSKKCLLGGHPVGLQLFSAVCLRGIKARAATTAPDLRHFTVWCGVGVSTIYRPP